MKQSDDFLTKGATKDSFDALLSERAQTMVVARLQGREVDFNILSTGPLLADLDLANVHWHSSVDLEEALLTLDAGDSSASHTTALFNGRTWPVSLGAKRDLFVRLCGASAEQVRMTLDDQKREIDLHMPYKAQTVFQIICFCGKVRGVLSSEYRYLDQQEVFACAFDYLSKRGWKPSMLRWLYCHDLTAAYIELTDLCRSDMDKYQSLCKAMNCAGTSFTPVVRISTSDTGGSAARIEVFLKKDSRLYLMAEPLTILHKGDGCTMEKFESLLGQILPQTQNGVAQMERLSDLRILWFEQACRHAGKLLGFNAGAVEQALSAYASAFDGGKFPAGKMTAHDVFFVMGEAVANMLDSGKYSDLRAETLNDSLYRLLAPSFDWRLVDSCAN